jgi:putative transcriptional regulator
MNCIQKYRKKAGLLQAEMAAEMDMTQGAISHYELGTRTPDIAICNRMLEVIRAHGVDCTLDELFPATEWLAA